VAEHPAQGEAKYFAVPHSHDPADTVCVDSGARGPDWASVSHGIYLSIEAAGVHRSLGVRVSFVQSISMDAWRPVHQRMMELGGNRRFEEFLLQQGIPRETPIREKYLTRAAKWYREDLRARAEGTECPEPLAFGTGHLPAAWCDLYPESDERTSVLRKRISGIKPDDSPEGPGVGRPLERSNSLRQFSRCWSACRAIKDVCTEVLP